MKERDRNQQLISFYLENNTLDATGQKFGGLTRERVRQILNANGIKPRKSRIIVKPFKPKQTTTEKFWSMVDKTPGQGPNGECWEWQGCRHKETGYGSVYIFKTITYSHRVALWFSSGKKIKNHALHHCDNPPCCNPEHLYDGTPADNMRDRDARGRGAHQKNPEAWKAAMALGWAKAHQKRRTQNNF